METSLEIFVVLLYLFQTAVESWLSDCQLTVCVFRTLSWFIDIRFSNELHSQGGYSSRMLVVDFDVFYLLIIYIFLYLCIVCCFVYWHPLWECSCAL